MNLKFPNSITLLNKVTELDLYKDLIAQLRKDFGYANVMFDLASDVTPEILQESLFHTVYELINHKFNDYLNLLYIIDVPEKQVKQLSSDDVLEIAQQVTFLILKREWQKVWFRKKYS